LVIPNALEPDARDTAPIAEVLTPMCQQPLKIDYNIPMEQSY
jgi:hypothetical protein